MPNIHKSVHKSHIWQAPRNAMCHTCLRWTKAHLFFLISAFCILRKSSLSQKGDDRRSISCRTDSFPKQLDWQVPAFVFCNLAFREAAKYYLADFFPLRGWGTYIGRDALPSVKRWEAHVRFMFLTTEEERSDLRSVNQSDLDCHRVVRITFVPTKASCEAQIWGN